MRISAQQPVLASVLVRLVAPLDLLSSTPSSMASLTSTYADKVGAAAVGAGLPSSSVAALLAAMETGEGLTGFSDDILGAATVASQRVYSRAFNLAWASYDSTAEHNLREVANNWQCDSIRRPRNRGRALYEGCQRIDDGEGRGNGRECEGRREAQRLNSLLSRRRTRIAQTNSCKLHTKHSTIMRAA